MRKQTSAERAVINKINFNESIIFILVYMENLLLLSKKRPQEGQNYSSLSPQRLKKPFNAQLTFTPSNIAQIQMHKDFSNQKKMQENMSKLRQTQAFNDIFKQRLNSLKQQKQGIQRTLYEQITMYKKMMAEKQMKNQSRIKELQQKFNLQMNRIIDQKEQEARNAQTQKKAMERRMLELEQMLQELYLQLQNKGKDHDTLVQQNGELLRVQDSLSKRLDNTEQAFREYQLQSKAQNEDFRRHLAQTQLQWKQQLKSQVQNKNKQLQDLQNQYESELQKLQDRGAQEHMSKSQQLKNLACTFQRETARLNSIVSKKDEQIQTLNRTLQSEKEKAYMQSKGYQKQINNSSHEKTRFKQEMIKAERKVQKLMSQNRQLQQRLSSVISQSQEETLQLKKDLQLLQVNLMREVDKNTFTVDDLSSEIARLRVQNEHTILLAEQNTHIHRQIRNMKELLIESSVEMERCKQQFFRIGRQKDMLVIKLREIASQNETLYRIKNQRQQEARGWRQSYFIQKNQY